MNKELLTEAANISRGLSMDAVHACNSGHLGLPLGAADIGAVLFGDTMVYNPANPNWLNRDRFILSAGHGSMFLYSWLHLSGYDLPLEEVKSFRKLHSKTPGHPEFGETVGVECTTGPLGQGVGNAVGMAISAKMAAEKFNTNEHTIFDYNVFCLAGDGCLQEGVAAESASICAHLGLDNLVLIYDSNDVTLDAMADASQSESAAGRFKAYGFDVVTIDGHDLDAIKEALDFARSNKNGKPKLIECKTTIGKGIPQVAGTASAHGEGGAKFVEESRSGLGLPDGSFYVSEAVKEFFAERNAEAANKNSQWQVNFDAWESANPDLADLLRGGIAKDVPADLTIKIPEFDTSKKIATRVAGEKVLNDIAAAMPLVTSGSADLHGSTKNYIKDGKDFTRDNADAKNILYGIREHAMGAIMNGIAYSGIFRTSGATFATFSDYMRPSVRLAALCKLPVFYIWTHDSVGVGEDGPTHQPVEITSALRCIPGLDVIRPADPEETAGAYISAINSIDNPTALILSRQGLPFIEGLTAQEKREGVLKGAYIVKKETTELETILLASGSELQLAIAAAKELGSGIRVVSVPCMEIFDRQNEDYRESLLPLKCTQRVAIEAGISGLWHKYTGLKGKVIGIDRFGLSAPGDIVMEQLGMTTHKVIEAVGEL